MKLTKTSGLRSLVAEHGSEVEELLREGGAREVVLDIGPDGPRRTFRPQCEGGPIPVLEGVHFLFHDVRLGPDAPGKQFCDLEDGDPNFQKAVDRGEATGCLLDETPTRHLLRKDILDALNSANHCFAEDWLHSPLTANRAP